MGKSWILLALLAAGCAAHNGTAKSGKEKDEGNETKIKFSEAPEAVQKTLTEQANGQKIESVDKQTKDGKTVFEADAADQRHQLRNRRCLRRHTGQKVSGQGRRRKEGQRKEGLK